MANTGNIVIEDREYTQEDIAKLINKDSGRHARGEARRAAMKRLKAAHLAEFKKFEAEERKSRGLS